MRGGQVYIAAADSDTEEWKPLGVLVALEVTNKDLDEESEIRWQEMIRNAKLINSFSVSTTFKIRGQLASREYLRRWFGFESPSLIHNGKKRRK